MYEFDNDDETEKELNYDRNSKECFTSTFTIVD